MTEYIYGFEPCEKIPEMKMVQREEIVRCRDCACWYRGYCGRHSYEVANQHGDTYTEGLFPMDEDDFCSLGERMEVRDD